MTDRDIDLCSELMIEDPITLAATARVTEAIDLLLRHGLHHLPVVDEAGRFVGLFGSSHVVRLLLPRAATLDGDADISFVHETLDDMRARVREAAGRPVADLTERDVPVTHPDTPLIRGLQLLYHTRTLVPVVAREDRRLLGVLAYRRLLEHLKG